VYVQKFISLSSTKKDAHKTNRADIKMHGKLVLPARRFDSAVFATACPVSTCLLHFLSVVCNCDNVSYLVYLVALCIIMRLRLFIDLENSFGFDATVEMSVSVSMPIVDFSA